MDAMSITSFISFAESYLSNIYLFIGYLFIFRMLILILVMNWSKSCISTGWTYITYLEAMIFIHPDKDRSSPSVSIPNLTSINAQCHFVSCVISVLYEIFSLSPNPFHLLGSWNDNNFSMELVLLTLLMCCKRVPWPIYDWYSNDNYAHINLRWFFSDLFLWSAKKINFHYVKFYLTSLPLYLCIVCVYRLSWKWNHDPCLLFMNGAATAKILMRAWFDLVLKTVTYSKNGFDTAEW